MGIAQYFSRREWVKKNEVGYAYPCLKETSDQRFLDRRYVKFDDKRFKELSPRLGLCAYF
jgi:hypothetical protein